MPECATKPYCLVLVNPHEGLSPRLSDGTFLTAIQTTEELYRLRERNLLAARLRMWHYPTPWPRVLRSPCRRGDSDFIHDIRADGWERALGQVQGLVVR